MDCQYGSQVESRMNNREFVRSAQFFCGLYFLCRLVAMGVSNLQTFHSLTGTLWYAFAEKTKSQAHCWNETLVGKTCLGAANA